jgi:hypothetical protein
MLIFGERPIPFTGSGGFVLGSEEQGSSKVHPIEQHDQ